MCYIVVFFSFFSVQAQQEKADAVKKRWRDLREENGFGPSDNFKGPRHKGYIDPSSINENQPGDVGSGNSNFQPYQGTPLTDKQIQRGRRKFSNPNGSGGSGTIESDPNVAPSQDADVPEVDQSTRRISSNSSTSGNFWLWVGMLLLVVILAYIVYTLVKNKQPSMDRMIPFEPLTEDTNPAVISKTELELRLEEAIAKEDFKECVRIYFLFAMKELIERRWIFWKKEKTNLHYLIEVQGKPGAADFEQIVTIYDLVWYGDYVIDRPTYETMQPTLDRCYKRIEAQK